MKHSVCIPDKLWEIFQTTYGKHNPSSDIRNALWTHTLSLPQFQSYVTNKEEKKYGDPKLQKVYSVLTRSRLEMVEPPRMNNPHRKLRKQLTCTICSRTKEEPEVLSTVWFGDFVRKGEKEIKSMPVCRKHALLLREMAFVETDDV